MIQLRAETERVSLSAGVRPGYAARAVMTRSAVSDNLRLSCTPLSEYFNLKPVKFVHTQALS